MTRRIGDRTALLDDAEVTTFVEQCLAEVALDDRSVCVVVPDATRRCPLRLLLPALERAVRDRARRCDAVIALGTHAPMSDAAITEMAGATTLPIRNHAWWDPSTFAHVGTLPAELVAVLSKGHLHEDVEVRVNRCVVDAEVTLIVGPVLPHEVVGFSGGHKYLFPGLSGQQLIDVTHWLGALITSREIIGTPGVTPVRALIEAAAALVPGERHALCVVTDEDSDALHAAAFGDPYGAWSAAVEVASATHVVHLEHPVRSVVSLVATRYTDLWTGAKGFYKVEPVVADGGEVLLVAPHITEIATTHPRMVELGYHCSGYFTANRDRFRDTPRGELAHSTHLYGAGTYDPVTGVEQQRVTVTLATGIPRATVESVNLSYRDPSEVDVAALEADPDVLVVHDAGEVLYRLR